MEKDRIDELLTSLNDLKRLKRDTHSEKSGGAKITVLSSIGLGVNTKSGKELQEVNRLSFVVPVKIDTIGSPRYSVM